MSTCKECIHYDVCEMKILAMLLLQDGKECKHFKDKSKIIELPCKVGDTVYKVMDIERVHRQILEMKVLSIEIKDTTKFFAKTVKKYRYNYGTFTLDDFGKTVFLTYEEAEKKLREIENND